MKVVDTNIHVSYSIMHSTHPKVEARFSNAYYPLVIEMAAQQSPTPAVGSLGFGLASEVGSVFELYGLFCVCRYNYRIEFISFLK